MAVLEAFVYDPLLNWRLLDATADKNRRAAKEATNAANAATIAIDLGDGSSQEDDLLASTANQGGGGGGGVGGGGAAAGIAGAIISAKTKHKEDEVMQSHNHPYPMEVTNEKARIIVDRVKQKLTGNDFNNCEAITVQRQVELLVQQATNNGNLCQCYIGWCPFW